MTTRILQTQKAEKEAELQHTNQKLFELDKMYSANRNELESKVLDLNKN
jgi:hypothetical protein